MRQQSVKRNGLVEAISGIDQKRQTARTVKNSLGTWLRWLGAVLLGLILLPLINYGAYFVLLGAKPANPQLIAHRGGLVYAPENTLAAFRHAIAAGADWLELDVQMTRDGELVVFHDLTVDRISNGNGQVKEMTLSELRALDLGDGEKVATFDEVLALAKEAGVGILPEAKAPQLYPGIEAKLLSALLEADYLDQTVVQSFNPQTLNLLKVLEPNIQTCPLYGLGRLEMSGPQPGGANIICPMAEMVILNPWMIRQAHAEGKKVFVWFGAIEHPLTMRFILALGADGLMVDDPVALASVLGR